MIDFKIQHPEFICHGADQSIAGLVAEQMKEKVYYIHSDMLRELGIQNVHRHPNRQYISTLPYIFRIFKINEWFYNSKVIQTIRSWFYEN